MNVKKMPLEELELLSYTDIAYELLKEEKKPKTTPVLFGEVCKLLKINDDNMMDMIGEFYTNLTTDKRFLLLDSRKWDLKEFHSVKTIIDEEDEEDEDEEVVEETEDDSIESNIDDFEATDDEMDDLEDLVVVTEEEMEE